MSDVTETLTQDAIAESLLSAPIVGDSREGALADHADETPSQQEQLADLSTDREEWRPQNQETDSFVREEAARRNAEQQGRQPQEQQPEAPQYTPEQLREGIQALDAIVQEQGLNDPQSAKSFADDFCAAFGTDIYKSGTDVAALGSCMAKTAYSALNVFESLQGKPWPAQLVPAESAKQFTHEFCRAWGVDPRTEQVNEQLLAETVLRGALSFIGTYNQFGGKVTDLAQLNSPENAEMFLTQFLAAFGIQGQVDRATALKVADSAGKYLLSFMQKMPIQARAPQRASRRGSSGRQGNRFRTNSDIFAPDVLERLDLEKANGRNTSEFTPKTRRGSSQFRTNQDIFNDESLADYQRL